MNEKEITSLVCGNTRDRHVEAYGFNAKGDIVTLMEGETDQNGQLHGMVKACGEDGSPSYRFAWHGKVMPANMTIGEIGKMLAVEN